MRELTYRANRKGRRSRGQVSLEPLEGRTLLSSNLHVVVTGPAQTIPLAVHAGDTVVIHAFIETSDPNDIHEVPPPEQLRISTSAGDFLDFSYNQTLTFSYKAKQNNEALTASIDDSDGDEDATLDIATQGLIVTPSNSQYSISAAPNMPDVSATVATPDHQDLSKVQFKWEAAISFPAADGTNAITDIPTEVFTKTVTGPSVTFSGSDWKNEIRGGRLQLTVTAITPINGANPQGSSDVLKILGTNPSQSAVTAYINSQTTPTLYPTGATFTYQQILKKIALQESVGSLEQFIANGTPLFSGAQDGGAGIMQITPPTAEQTWDWKANINAAVKIFNHTLELPLTYVSSLTKYVNSTLLPQINAARVANRQTPLKAILLPAFTANQQVDDAIRGFNGFDGTDPVDSVLHLHEYALAQGSGGVLTLSINSTTMVGTASWIDVGFLHQTNPNYVTEVLNQ